MRTLAAILLALLPAAAGAESGERMDPLLVQAGDALQFGVPLFALGLTFLLDPAPSDTGQFQAQPLDWTLDAAWPRMNGSPRHDLALAIGRTEIATYALKFGIDEQRPNGHGQSFPSGHTSVAFAGAEFVRKQYGWGWGLPAYAAASYVGWSRVESGNHWTHDVLGGAALGILSNHDTLSFDLPHQWGTGAVSLTPTLPARVGQSFVPADSVLEQMERQPQDLGIGLRLEVRF